MGSRVNPSRIVCINCNICINKMRRYPALELDTRVTALICSWSYPQIVLEDDYVCEACRDLAMAAVNQNLSESASSSQETGPSLRGHRNVCLLCGCSTLNRQSDRIYRENPTDLQQSIINVIETTIVPRRISPTDRVCHACWLRSKRQAVRMQQDEIRPLRDITNDVQQENVLPSTFPVQPEGRQTIILPNYRRAANSTHKCVFPDCISTTLHNVSDKLRAKIVHKHNYYIPKLARVCREHLENNTWHLLFDSQNSIESFNVEQIQHVFSFVNTFKQLNFEDVEDIDDKIFKYWVGLSKEKFNTLLTELPRVMALKRGKIGLIALLIKMRTGESNIRISNLLKLSRKTMENIMNSVRQLLCQDFVPNYLGINALSRNELRGHSLTIPNGLFGNGNNVVVMCDGTYIYVNKSSNYKFQKDTYSLHKFKNLLKPFLIVASDGYIVDCFGPYKATTSDAAIMNDLFRDESSALRLYFRNNDSFILDRGFRDSVGLLESCGYRPYMPDSLLAGEHQLTTMQANQSRCVTVCRWVVEVVNGYFKRDYKLFRQEYYNKSLPHMMQYFKIAAALINKFGVRLQDNAYANQILSIITQNINLPNNLASMVDATNMNRRTSNFRSLTVGRHNLYFPELGSGDLILLALGTYQIRQARSYYGEHVRSHGEYKIEVSSEQHDLSEYNLRGSIDTSLIRGKIQSRHISRKKYYVYILIENSVPGRAGIVEYCCSCIVGRRTIGCCAHIMTLIWYLGWARHQQNITAPADFLDEIVMRDEH